MDLESHAKVNANRPQETSLRWDDCPIVFSPQPKTPIPFDAGVYGTSYVSTIVQVSSSCWYPMPKIKPRSMIVQTSYSSSFHSDYH